MLARYVRWSVAGHAAIVRELASYFSRSPCAAAALENASGEEWYIGRLQIRACLLLHSLSLGGLLTKCVWLFLLSVFFIWQIVLESHGLNWRVDAKDSEECGLRSGLACVESKAGFLPFPPLTGSTLLTSSCNISISVHLIDIQVTAPGTQKHSRITIGRFATGCDAEETARALFYDWAARPEAIFTLTGGRRDWELETRRIKQLRLKTS